LEAIVFTARRRAADGEVRKRQAPRGKRGAWKLDCESIVVRTADQARNAAL
jgi:hypothetical protein